MSGNKLLLTLGLTCVNYDSHAVRLHSNFAPAVSHSDPQTHADICAHIQMRVRVLRKTAWTPVFTEGLGGWGGVKKSSPQTNSWDPCSACFLCRSQAVCSLNRPDLSSACGAASVFDCAHASPFTFGERLSGGVGFARRRLCPEPHVLAALIFYASLLFFTNFKSVLSPCVSDPVAFNPEFRDQTRPARQQITLTSQPGEN